MTDPLPALAPAPALFDVTTLTDTGIDGTLARRPARAARAGREPAQDDLPRRHRTARRNADAPRPTHALPRLAPSARAARPPLRRPTTAARRPGQPTPRRQPRLRGLAPVRSLVVLLLDHEPGREEILRIQAQANRSEELALVDQQAQFGDCWQARAGLPEARPDRRRLRRPGHLAQEGAQPPPPTDAARSDPRPRRRATRRQPAVGHARQPARRHARDRARAHRGGRDAHHQPGAARRRAARPRRVRAPHARRGRTRLRRADRRRRAARRATSRSRAPAPS